jgi:hypothetical protein
VKGPLVVGWRSLRKLGEIQAGTSFSVHIELENQGSAVWRPGRVRVAYHWLDENANAIVWDGRRTEFGRSVLPGDTVAVEAQVRAPVPPGPYRLAFDLVAEGRCWFAELGNSPLETLVAVARRDANSATAHLASVRPASDWYQRVSAAHEQGYAAVGGSLSLITKPLRRGRRLRAFEKELEQYRPGGGRDPAFTAPLICPSLLAPLTPNTIVAGLPAWQPVGEEPWLFDGQITAQLEVS